MGARAGSFAFLVSATLFTSALGVAWGGCAPLPDITFDDGDAAASNDDDASDFEGGGAPNCTPTGPEICDDGVDNDCNGKTDCADQRCTNTGFSCQSAPDGWKVVSFSGDQKPPCPANEQATDLKIASGDGSASCACSCTSVGGSCQTGNFALDLAGDPSCTGGATAAVSANAVNCTQLGAPINVPNNGHAKITEPTTPTSCNANSSLNGVLTTGRVCDPIRYGKGCNLGQVCTLRTTLGLLTCVARDGKFACPFGYAKRNTVGTSANDTRTCSACTCGAPTPCTGGSLSLFDDAMCKANGGHRHTDAITAACDTTADSNFTATYFKASTPGGGCSGVPTSPSVAGGTLDLANERTICCR